MSVNFDQEPNSSNNVEYPIKCNDFCGGNQKNLEKLKGKYIEHVRPVKNEYFQVYKCVCIFDQFIFRVICGVYYNARFEND